MKTIDLNSDLGEGFASYHKGDDYELLSVISSANIACGFHAGDPIVMDRTVQWAVQQGVAIGAHPGFPDLLGFGRRALAASPHEVYTYVKYQLGALMAFAQSHGSRVAHLKPHGALYTMAAVDAELANAIARAVADVDRSIIVVGLANSEIVKAGQALGLLVANEVFADRTYQPSGQLVPRSQPGAVIGDESRALAQALDMVMRGQVTAIDGTVVKLTVDTICVHGDTPKALKFVLALREHFSAAGISIVNMSQQLSQGVV